MEPVVSGADGTIDESSSSEHATRSVAVVIGGGPVRRPAPSATFDLVIAADSGVDIALAAGLVPTHVVGDLDSISDDGVAWAAAAGVPVERHPTDKDATDTALALGLAVSLGAEHVVLFGGTGIDRFDHLLGTVVALGDPALAALHSVTAHLGASTLHVLHAGRSVHVELPAGDVFSLLPLHGACSGIDVVGARWPLHDAVLPAGSTRGVSNESVGQTVHVTVASGVLTVVVPRPESPTPESITPESITPGPKEHA